MTRDVLREPELKTLIDGVIEKAESPRLIAVRFDGAWHGPTEIVVADHVYDVAVCRSVLAVREELARDRAAERSLVILTDRENRDLGEDVLARLAKERIIARDPWDSVKRLFGAVKLDPALADHPWLASALLDAAPPSGYAPVASGCLDEETAWHALLSVRLGIEETRLDLTSLLRWTARRAGPKALGSLPDEVRLGFLDRCRRQLGTAGAIFTAILRANRGEDGIPIGLASAALFAEGTNGDLAIEKAITRLEGALGGDSIERGGARRYALAAEEAVRSLALAEDRHTLTARAERLLHEFKASDHAWRSSYLPSGFDQRRERLAAAMDRALDGAGSLDDVEARFADVLSHARAQEAAREPIEMAVRLTRWLVTASNDLASTFTAAVLGYATQSALVDRARDAIQRGDAGPEAWARVNRRLLVAARERRRAENQRFAALLVAAEKSGEPLGESVVRIERVLDEIVAPLAKLSPVLVLVVDGMSVAVHSEMIETLNEHGFFERCAEGSRTRRFALAAFPTVTEISRASLLTGSIARGSDDVERAGFESHAGLRAACSRNRWPRLFHKGQLRGTDGLGLAEEVRAELADPNRKVIGIIVNAVDDHLSKGDQTRAPWKVDSITPLAWILDAAREGGRVVVLTADHGHVLEHGQTTQRNGDGGGRWRLASSELSDGEVRVEGPRVLGGSNQAVHLPWTEDIRYCAKQNGYHGGCTPQEAIVPVSIWAEAHATFAGWKDARPELPAWWNRETECISKSTVAPSAETPPPKGQLFDNRPGSPPSLVDRLLHSPMFNAQKKLIARAALSDEQIRAIVEALLEHGGTLTRAALAARIDFADFRLGGLLAHLSRVLNVDGYEVLTVNVADHTIRLNPELLVAQFDC